MRIYLTDAELRTKEGGELLQLCLAITADGRIDLEEIKGLRRWLRANGACQAVAGIGYLSDIMGRITADGVIDRDELLELHLAVERVIPTAHRTAAVQARKSRDAERRERRKQQERLAKQQEKEAQKRLREEERLRALRIQHAFGKVAGVTFPNDDGTERQAILRRCQVGEQLVLQHDAYNEYSVNATKVLRMNGEQLGHLPEYLAEDHLERLEEGYGAVAVLLDLTGGTPDKPTRGANYAIFYCQPGVTNEELNTYAQRAYATR